MISLSNKLDDWITTTHKWFQNIYSHQYLLRIISNPWQLRLDTRKAIQYIEITISSKYGFSILQNDMKYREIVSRWTFKIDRLDCVPMTSLLTTCTSHYLSSVPRCFSCTCRNRYSVVLEIPINAKILENPLIRI